MSEIHGWTHAPNGADAIEGAYEIKVFLDPGHPAAEGNPELTDVAVGDGLFVWPVPRDIAGAYLREAEAAVSTAGDVTVQIRNVTQAVDMLSTPVTISGGAFTSYSGTPAVVSVDDSQVLLEDLLAIDVTAVSGTPQGLCVILNFGPRLSV